MLGKPAPGPICPCVKILTSIPGCIFQQVQLSFQAGIQHGAADAVLPQATGQSRNPARRLAGLGDGGVDQKKMGDGLPPLWAESHFLVSGFIHEGDRLQAAEIRFAAELGYPES